MPLRVALIIGLILAISAVVALYAFILPEKKRAELKGFFRVLHDILNVRQLILEKILKFLYVLNTMLCVFIGFFLLFAEIEVDLGWLGKSSTSTFVFGLVLIILGPIVVRLIHEATIMMILLVKNTMEINQKLKGTAKDPFEVELPKTGKSAAAAASYSAPDYKEQSVTDQSYAEPQNYQSEQMYQNTVYQTPEMTHQSAGQRFCPTCGSLLKDGDMFCKNCGTRLNVN